MLSPLAALVIAVVAIGITAIWHVSNVRRQSAMLTEATTRLTIKSMAATLAAPHLNPNPEATQDNLIILAAWEKTAEGFLRP